MLYTTQNLFSLKTSPMRIFHKVRNLNWGSHNFKTRLSIAKVMQLQKKKTVTKASYSPSLNFVPIPVPHPSFNIPSVDWTEIIWVWITSNLHRLQKDIQQRHFPKKDWLYPEETRQHVLPQRCVLVTICLFVFNFLWWESKHKATKYMPIFSFFCLLVFFTDLLKMLVLKP